MIRDLLHAADFVLLGSLAWVVAFSAITALGLLLIVAGSIHTYRRCNR